MLRSKENGLFVRIKSIVNLYISVMQVSFLIKGSRLNELQIVLFCHDHYLKY